MVKNDYWGKFCLVFSAFIGVCLGAVFLWIGLVVKHDLLYFAVGIIMMIFGMLAGVALLSDYYF